MPLHLTAVPASQKQRLNMDEIDPDVMQAVEEAYEFGQANPGMKLQTPEFADKAGAEEFLKHARSYAYWRKDSTGRLTVTGNPVKGQTKGTFVARFSVTDFVEPAPATPVAQPEPEYADAS